jgi:transposase-like protein
MTKAQINRQSKRKFSIEEKRTYYIAWENSGLSLADFCRSHGISRSALYQWSKRFKKEDSQSDFSPLVMPNSPAVTTLTQLTITSGSDDSVQLKISIPEHRLVSFIKEMCSATPAIR